MTIGAGAYAYWVGVEHRLMAVAPGRLYRSAAMPPAELVDVATDLGIRTVVDLRDIEGDAGEEREDLEDAIATERAALDAAGVGYVNLPSRQVATPEQIRDFLAIMDQPANWPVLVHCEHGVGRSVLYSAIFGIEYKYWSRRRALRYAYWTSGLGNFAASSGKGGVILNYKRREKVARRALERSIRRERRSALGKVSALSRETAGAPPGPAAARRSR